MTTLYFVGYTGAEGIWGDQACWDTESGGAGTSDHVPTNTDELIFDSNSPDCDVDVAIASGYNISIQNDFEGTFYINDKILRLEESALIDGVGTISCSPGAAIEFNVSVSGQSSLTMAAGSNTIHCKLYKVSDFNSIGADNGVGTLEFLGSGQTIILDSMIVTTTIYNPDNNVKITSGKELYTSDVVCSGSTDHLSKISSTTPGSRFFFTIDSPSYPTVSYMDIQDATAGNGWDIIAWDGTNYDRGNNDRIAFPSSLKWYIGNAGLAPGAWGDSKYWSTITYGPPSGGIPSTSQGAMFDSWSPHCTLDTHVDVGAIYMSGYIKHFDMNGFNVTCEGDATPPSWTSTYIPYYASNPGLVVLSGCTFSCGSGTLFPSVFNQSSAYIQDGVILNAETSTLRAWYYLGSDNHIWYNVYPNPGYGGPQFYFTFSNQFLLTNVDQDGAGITWVGTNSDPLPYALTLGPGGGGGGGFVIQLFPSGATTVNLPKITGGNYTLRASGTDFIVNQTDNIECKTWSITTSSGVTWNTSGYNIELDYRTTATTGAGRLNVYGILNCSGVARNTRIGMTQNSYWASQLNFYSGAALLGDGICIVSSGYYDGYNLYPNIINTEVPIVIDSIETSVLTKLDGSITVSGTNTFAISPGTILVIASGSSITFAGLDCSGTAGSPITIQSDVTSGTYYWNSTTPGQSISYTTISDCHASGGEWIVASDGTNTNAGNNLHFLWPTGPSGVFGTTYSTSGLIIPLIRKSSGPIIVSSISGSYSGTYGVVVVTGTSGGLPIDTLWNIYGEIPTVVTASGTYFQQYSLGSGTMDQFGRLPTTFSIAGSSLTDSFADQTGTSGGYIGVWAQTPGFITPYVKIPYRVVT